MYVFVPRSFIKYLLGHHIYDTIKLSSSSVFCLRFPGSFSIIFFFFFAFF